VTPLSFHNRLSPSWFRGLDPGGLPGRSCHLAVNQRQ
jgi:hypothetical protein